MNSGRPRPPQPAPLGGCPGPPSGPLCRPSVRFAESAWSKPPYGRPLSGPVNSDPIRPNPGKSDQIRPPVPMVFLPIMTRRSAGLCHIRCGALARQAPLIRPVGRSSKLPVTFRPGRCCNCMSAVFALPDYNRSATDVAGRLIANPGQSVAIGFTFAMAAVRSLSFVVISCVVWPARCGAGHIFLTRTGNGLLASDTQMLSAHRLPTSHRLL